MQNDVNHRGFRVVLASALALACAVTYSAGCGHDEPEEQPDEQCEETPTGMPDAGMPTDAGTPPVDSNLAIVRLNTDGSLDNTFGTNGVARVDLAPSGTSVRDSLWSMARDATNRLVLFGSKKGDGERIDSDRVVVRLNTNGTLDESFATKGIHTFNLGGLSDQARNGIVQPDGKIVASGYYTQPSGVGAQTANRIVLLRLNDNGTLDSSFGSKGVVNSAPFEPADRYNTEWGTVEAYAAGYQSGKYVTTGYGRRTADGTLDLISFRYDATGKLDTSWGNGGALELDLEKFNDRGRNLAVLSDDRVFMVGSGSLTTSNVDAMVVMVQANGTLDTSFNTKGHKLFDFGRPDEAFYGVAISPDGKYAAAAGYRAGGGEDDDALLLITPLTAEGTESAQAVELSTTANDRFWSVAFDASGKIYAAGFINEGGDNRMAVVRFNTNGTRDTTFGTGGLVTVNVIPGKTEETARALVVQTDGKIVLAGVAEAK